MEAERRYVTILFADMVGFTAFAGRAGEEAAFMLMQSLAKLMEDAVREQGGAVQSFTGDGIMAVFGAPVAFEDAPLRACRAAAAILDKVKSAGDDLEARGLRPQLRVGLNSGPAVVGKVQVGSDSGVTVLGDTVNVAARLQALAEPDTTVMSEVTHRLVEGLVEVHFIGQHQIKGKSDPQKVYRLDGVRERGTRFAAKIQRGLTHYVGRDRELEKLGRGFDALGAGVQVFDIAGEPGIGKSRLVHEFLAKIVRDRARVLTGSCTPDGQQTPFRAFIEIVRGAFRLSLADSEAIVARKLDEGLQGLGLRNHENLGLLLNLLGLEAPEGALQGLDGVLIGLRTRELLDRLARARSRLTPLVLVFEDLHWLDSASEDLLARIVAIDEPLRLLIVHTRRPEYAPPWVGQRRVTRLPMEPLSAGETARIAEARLGVDDLPEALAKLIAAKAGGNALFAEEIASFVIERGIVRRSAAGLEFDASAVAGALPESVQSLLASRVDRLTPADRKLLQTAAVIGRSFDPDLVAAVAGMGETGRTSFEAMEALDLIGRSDESIDYAFKHALVRDALYNGLLSSPRAALHLKVAEELERRGGNRLMEIAEVLAHHYAETPRVEKAFAYLAMAGDKSLDVYSLPEAEQYFRKALEIFEMHGAPGDRWSVVRVILRLETLTNKGAWREAGVVASKFMPFIREFGETPELVNALYYQAMALWAQLDSRSAREVVLEELSVADRLGDRKARFFAQGNLLFVTSFLGLNSEEAASQIKQELIKYGPKIDDTYIVNWCYYAIGWDYFYRGLVKETREVATQLIATGEARNDPRAIGQANMLLGYAEMFGDNFIAAISHAEECVRVAVTPNERRQGALIKAASRVLLGYAQEELAEIHAINSELQNSGMDIAVQDAPLGVALAMLGQIAQGIRVIENEIAKSDFAGDQTRAAWHRIILAELFIQILSGKDKPGARVLIKNLRTIFNVIIFGARRARRLLEQAASVQQLSERGLFVARINLDLGVLSAMKKKPDEARRYFERARIGAEDQGADKLLQKIHAALAELH